jgi:hypothetical protein
MSYSRSKAHYDATARRYMGPAYSYQCVVGAADQLVADGFLGEERALPGDHRLLAPRQSTLWVRHELVAEFCETDINVNYHPVLRADLASRQGQAARKLY